MEMQMEFARKLPTPLELKNQFPVSERVKTHGRAFADPEKGAPGQALSAMQGRKLKEITAKAKGEAPKRRWGRKTPKAGVSED